MTSLREQHGTKLHCKCTRAVCDHTEHCTLILDPVHDPVTDGGSESKLRGSAVDDWVLKEVYWFISLNPVHDTAGKW